MGVARPALTLSRVGLLARFPALSDTVQPGPRPMSGPPRVSDTLVCGRVRATATFVVQKLAHVRLTTPRRLPSCRSSRSVESCETLKVRA